MLVENGIWSVLLVKETWKNHRQLSQVTDNLYHILLYWVHLTMWWLLPVPVIVSIICFTERQRIRKSKTRQTTDATDSNPIFRHACHKWFHYIYLPSY
jgi:hypothetical protein